MKEGGYHGTPLQQDRRSRRSTGRYPASFSVEWSHGYFHAPLPVPRDLPAGGREVVLPGRRPDCPPPRAGDTLKPWNNKATIYGGMP